MNKANRKRESMEEKTKKFTDYQRYAFQITINNPTPDYNHDIIKGIMTADFKTLRYFCMADELSESGTLHTHIYVCFNSRVRWSKVKKAFPTGHIEFAHGTVLNNIEYIKKIGKWENTHKAETRIEGTFYEWGTPPNQKGVRPEMEELYEMIKAGLTNSEILAFNNDYILNIDKLDKVRTMLLIDENKSKRRLDLFVTYIYGVTGAGKTRGVLDKHSDENCYRVTDYQHPFDGYECQPVMIFDEFRSSIKISELLNYADVYPIQLNARYSNKFACYKYLYLISNLKLEEQYVDVQRESPETWKAFLRRIHKVIHYEENGKITEYTIKEYLERNEKFRSLSKEKQLENPFDKGDEEGG